MATALYTHEDCLDHVTPPGHPERAARLEAVWRALEAPAFGALDRREAAYLRAPAADQVRHGLSHAPQIAVYTIPEGRHGAPDAARPVLLSYLDVVVQGYLREFGEDGVRRFFDTTHGWDAPILDDRTAPRYPRHVALSADERALTDSHLARLDATILPDAA